MSINSKPYDGRPECQQIGHCMSGCAIGANGRLLHQVPNAEKTGNYEIRPESMVLDKPRQVWKSNRCLR